ncbi:hypothetical protein [Streptomyces sp. NPDC002685]
MDINSLIGTVFPGLSALVVEDVAEVGGTVVVTANLPALGVRRPGLPWTG